MYALDLTPAFDELLQKNGGGPTAKAAFDLAKTDGFLREAYKINSHITALSQELRDVRQAYLSTAPPRRIHHPRRQHRAAGEAAAAAFVPLTDAQREAFDADAKRVLRDLHASIRSLADAEALHQETQQALIRKQHGGPSLRLPFVGTVVSAGAAAGGLLPKSAEQAAAEEAQRQAAAHRESVLWYLRQRLQVCGRAQQTMMEARLARMVVETSSQRALLAATTTMTSPAAAATAAAALEEEEQLRSGDGGGGGLTPGGRRGASSSSAPSRSDGPDEAGLTAEQLQMFERGNQDMVKYYENTLDKVRGVEQSLVEISELQTMLVSNLEIQSAHVDQMVADSVNTAENVAKGNKELKKALDRPSTARYTFYAASGLCLFVVVWDFFV